MARLSLIEKMESAIKSTNESPDIINSMLTSKELKCLICGRSICLYRVLGFVEVSGFAGGHRDYAVCVKTLQTMYELPVMALVFPEMLPKLEAIGFRKHSESHGKIIVIKDRAP